MIEVYRDGESDRKRRECEGGITMEESVKTTDMVTVLASV